MLKRKEEKSSSFVKSYRKFMEHDFGKVLVLLNIMVIIIIPNLPVRRLRPGEDKYSVRDPSAIKGQSCDSKPSLADPRG